MIAYCRHPAGIDRILHHLRILAMRKRMDSKDPDRIAYILADDSERFSRGQVTEVEMIIMVDDFIENVTSSFYPDYAKMKECITVMPDRWRRSYGKKGRG